MIATNVMSPVGEVVHEGELASLTYHRHYPYPPELVWAALTEPGQLKQWFMMTARIEGRVGGAVELIAGQSRFHVTGTVLAWEPPRVCEYEWNVEPRAELPQGERSVVRWELAAAEGGTQLTLTHRRLTRNTALGFGPGYHAFLDRLGAQLGGAALPDWQQRYAEVKAGYPASPVWPPRAAS